MKKYFSLFLFCVFFFLVEANEKQTIGIFTYQTGLMPWDPDTVHTGLHGSEESVVYMSQKLANLGYQVIVYGIPPENSQHTLPDANPRYVPLDFKEPAKLDIAISWRMPWIAHELKNRANLVFLWPHDTWIYPLTETQIIGFDDVLWVSDFQRDQWSSVNPLFSKFTHICGNGINPEQFPAMSEKKNPHACIYGSNYARGLEVLLNIWPEIKLQFPKATLDIYYGWQHWGLLTPEKEAEMKTQIANLTSLGVTEHGKVGHAELNHAYEKAAIWAYPCIGLEVFCITALRAQLSGVIPVIITGGALAETVPHGYKCNTVAAYTSLLKKALEDSEKISLEERKAMGSFILEKYTWNIVAAKWKAIFDHKNQQTAILTIEKNAFLPLP